MARVTIVLEDQPDGTVAISVEFEPQTPEVAEQTAAHVFAARMLAAGRDIATDVTGDEDWGINEVDTPGRN